MDPIGLALDNFDVTGRWRYPRERACRSTRAGSMYDGTPVSTPTRADASAAQASDSARASFTENLMAYALGRRVEDYDQPTIRAIARAARSERLHDSRRSSWAS